ncbi:MAG: c-type cytochrome [Planctomycetaceae bacterium]
MDIPMFPVNDFGPAMKGMIIGGLGILHVFLAQFAIGGGMMMCYFEWLSQTGRVPFARQFVDGYFKLLVLVSFVVGAVTGVGMWFTSIQISPRTIGTMVQEFHWLWAVEWTFFTLEVVSGYCFYRCGPQLPDTIRLRLLAIYSTAAWGSLFWINGILSWQLTPGSYFATHSVWDGFFNPSFWPSLIFRTISSMTIAALVACVVLNFVTRFDREQRVVLQHRAVRFLIPMVAMPALAVWYFLVLPVDSREWVLGGSVVMSMFFALGAACSLLIGAYAVAVMFTQGLYLNGATAALLASLAFLATAGGEFVREGVRKPYTIRQYLYSNSITQDEVAYLREVGCLNIDPWPVEDPDTYPTDDLRRGAHVFRIQCSICHTIDGANGLVHLAGKWTPMQLRLNIAQLQRTKPFMPPFAGTAEEVDWLSEWIAWQSAGRPSDWDRNPNAPTLAQVDEWLDEVGTTPGIELPEQPQEAGR